MNRLRTKIALLLVVAIVLVVGALTGVLLFLLRPPGTHQTMGPIAEQVLMLEKAAKEAPNAVALASAPAGGKTSTEKTDWLREELRKRGSDLAASVSRLNSDSPDVVSIPLATGQWFLMPISDLPPRSGIWGVMLTWLALITFGATAIAVFVANRMVRPLVLLEQVVEAVGSDDVLPELPVEGPAEVKAASKALNSLSLRLKAAIESRMRVVAAAGHDLRTPITRMRLRAEFVADDEDRAMWLKDIEELEGIADSAIELVREETGKKMPEDVRLDTLIEEIVGELQDQGHDITLQSSEPALVSANRLALRRALRNLTINAATHGLCARIRMQMASRTAHVLIEDEGPGIPAHLMDNIFEPFFRVDPARRKSIPGSGLGLTIAHEIISRARGRLIVENSQSKGLIQRVELPIIGE
ncbi:MAG: ATP-binding protein [Hyphomicrobium sp.]|uniref:ATP-binding protein n=1 Tax=Hyphomicrobium sp. TaxID=82 RepID=UPI0039E500E5